MALSRKKDLSKGSALGAHYVGYRC